MNDCRSLTTEGALAGGHLVENQSEGENVGARVQLRAPHLLRRHVTRRAHGDSGAGEGGINNFYAVILSGVPPFFADPHLLRGGRARSRMICGFAWESNRRSLDFARSALQNSLRSG